MHSIAVMTLEHSVNNMQCYVSVCSRQGSKFVVAIVADATMFSHLLPGCSCGSKHLLPGCSCGCKHLLLLYYMLSIGFLVHAFLCNVCNAINYTT